MTDAYTTIDGDYGYYHDAEKLFSQAIMTGRLSEVEGSANFAGDFMYMGSKGGRHLFKHIGTREYLA